MTIHPDLTVDMLMRQWPESIRIFIRHRMLCVGCPIAGLHSIDDACREHDVPLSRFMAAVDAAVAATAASASPSAVRPGAEADAARG